ncbi:putative disease resistance RPP13-like protein 1 [Zea mays]|uniref:Putative disease resistance RPP13-like protein 1 n=1 Tax=Zea mays TaxID=4577 RepID=A0A3L6G5L5_MAIZE|nr:putative disease resistance RPP13-like protein 1 [Zea mays]
MEVALGTAKSLLGHVLNNISDDWMKSYVSSAELGTNLNLIKEKMRYARALLDVAKGRDDVVARNPNLLEQLETLGKKADEAEDAVDELHYFMIQDKHDGTRDAAPELGGGLAAQAHHARHAARHTAGNWLSCFSRCCPRPRDDAAATDAMSGDGGHVGKLPFNRVAMSNKIKLLIEELQSNSTPVSDLLKIVSDTSNPQDSSSSTKRPPTSSQITQDKLFGRDAIFQKTIEDIIIAKDSGKTLSVLPIFGLGGIGKTTFTQHLYNHTEFEKHFTVRVWICVSTNFDVLRLTKEILSCLPATENAGDKIANDTTNFDLLQKSIAERLKSKRFLIVLDDIWECSNNEEWEKLVAPFKKNDTTGNVILVTTRFQKIADLVKKETNPVDLRGLDPDEFWKFFQICAFGSIQNVKHGDQELIIGIARQIADKLKCSPLAAKTVGRLLIKKPLQEHWMKILENKQWLEEKHDNDVIPALQISYDYLPFHLKKCFSSFALFPEDYNFDKSEIIRFWDSIGIIGSSAQQKKIEDIGSDYLDELLDSGFLIKGDNDFYVMHDLLLDLSRTVSKQECAYIDCSSFEANNIPQSIRYLSISMHDHCAQNFEEEMGKLKEKIDIKNLRTLMIFGEYTRLHLVNILRDTFKEIRRLRVLSIFMYSHSSLPNNFPELIHLRYLKLSSRFYVKISLPNTVSRFYHLKFLDLEQWGSDCSLPKDISRLENLRHFIASKEFHTNVPEVGKMKFLQELKEFHVKKENVGFELGELEKLAELGGELNILGLEMVRTEQEAKDAKLMSKRNLVELGLVWNTKQESTVDDILDSMQPHSNLRRLFIVNHGGTIGPSWLSSDTIYMKNLETLHLESVSWANLPPIGQFNHLRKLRLSKIVGISQIGPGFFGSTTEKSVSHLKEVEFNDMPELVEWVGGANWNLFSGIERIRCTNCPRLTGLLISDWSISSIEDNTVWFPNLHDLYIYECPKLCLPPLPHTSKVSRIRTGDFFYDDRTMLEIKNPSRLAFQNLGDLENLIAKDALLFSFMDLKKLHSLRRIWVNRCDETFLRGLDDGVAIPTVQSLELGQFTPTKNSLSNVFKCFPALSSLDVMASPSDEDPEEVVLHFPPSSSLRDVTFNGCKNLILPMEEGAGFCGLTSLESVAIKECNKLFSRWSIGGRAAQTQSIINPLPPYLRTLSLYYMETLPQEALLPNLTSLEKLTLHNCLGCEQSTEPMALPANLTSLTSLELFNCRNITMDGFDPRITFSIKSLWVENQRNHGTDPYSVAADLLVTVVRTKTMPDVSFKLVRLYVDNISGVLVAPICRLLSATLEKLSFSNDWRTENFTKEQDEALQLLTSLESLGFYDCRALQSLPQGLHRLPSLQQIIIRGPQNIISLPKEGLPDSLRLLQITNCCAEIYEACQQLKGTRPDIDVFAFKADVQN